LRYLLKCVFGLAVAAVLMPIDRANAADPFFDDLTGNWRGNGFVRVAANSPEENIRCRINNVLRPNGNELAVVGNCIIGGFFLPVDGSVVARGRSAYSADIFRTLARLSTNDFVGRRRGSQLSLSFKGKDSLTREDISATMLIRKRGDGSFDVLMRRTDPTTRSMFDVGTIRFKIN
jgi:hypothetical protein